MNTKYEDYDTINKGYHPLEPFIAERFCCLSSGENILDVGCGDGSLIKIFKDLGIKCDGFDISKEAIRLCKKQGLKNIKVSSIEDYKTRKKYDYIFCFSTLYYLENFRDDFKKILSLLKDDGYLIVNFPNPLRKQDRFTSVRYNEFMSAIINNDLEIVEVIPQSVYTGGIKNKYLTRLNIYILSKNA